MGLGCSCSADDNEDDYILPELSADHCILHSQSPPPNVQQIDEIGTDEDHVSNDDDSSNNDADEEERNRAAQYPWGKHLIEDQSVCEPAFCRITGLYASSNHHSHDVPTLWKRMFYHFKGQPIELPSNDADCKQDHKTFANNLNIEIMETELESDQLLQALAPRIKDQLAFPKENPLRMHEIYECKLKAVVEARQDNQQLSESLENYVERFELKPLPENLQSFSQPKFVAKFQLRL